MNKAKIGQSTMEYIIIFAVMAGVIVAVAWAFKGKVGSAYSGLSGKMNSAVYGDAADKK
ncbi:MAG TPA: hypothetical protein PL125_05120 [Candidatus Omnitrophota bacterium]|nr:hypothetical protein [Candidatus Omnitrophota bacterium]HPT39558.1 hypothetical protein [Candidatus Omnitrophota bacterium]